MNKYQKVLAVGILLSALGGFLGSIGLGVAFMGFQNVSLLAIGGVLVVLGVAVIGLDLLFRIMR